MTSTDREIGAAEDAALDKVIEAITTFGEKSIEAGELVIYVDIGGPMRDLADAAYAAGYAAAINAGGRQLLALGG
jgi:hypothetical protein